MMQAFRLSFHMRFVLFRCEMKSRASLFLFIPLGFCSHSANTDTQRHMHHTDTDTHIQSDTRRHTPSDRRRQTDTHTDRHTQTHPPLFLLPSPPPTPPPPPPPPSPHPDPDPDTHTPHTHQHPSVSLLAAHRGLQQGIGVTTPSRVYVFSRGLHWRPRKCCFWGPSLSGPEPSTTSSSVAVSFD